MYPSSHDINAKYAQGYAAAAPMNIHTRQSYPSPYGTAARWSTGLFHCCDDPANCLITGICPCVTFGQIAEIVNKGSISCAASGAVYGLLLGFSCLSCLYACVYRSRLRAQYDLEEAPCADCLVHFCCETCALCQEYRELKNRGFDMGIGWQANVDRQSRGITVAPAVGGMTR
ncbi:Plant cadmium resistance 2 [Melia azedarach]|uniref:Plant cadmium resistance 2 n=1 Tax=Melia azedarach TaxID=155640 RepID=A0ACC1XUU1_MELAZ|nr:Plant cadmium resistance 2 [Melia azedarach]